SILSTGIDSLNMDVKEKKLTVTKTVDPVAVACKLRKFWYAKIFSIGLTKEEEKKEELKKEENKPTNPYSKNTDVIVHHDVPAVEESPFGCAIY
ncbi:putative heavy metal-associated isoprenylated plant protein 39, partial [Cocos nucifera]